MKLAKHNLSLVLAVILLTCEIIYFVIRRDSLQTHEEEAQIFAVIAAAALTGNIWYFDDKSPNEQREIAFALRLVFLLLSVGYQLHNVIYVH